MVNIAIDAMGGDTPVQARISACLKFLSTQQDCTIFLFGHLPTLNQILKKYWISDKMAYRSRLILIASPSEHEVLMTDKASFAIKNKTQSSMAMAIEHVRQKLANGVISAGNTSALVLFTKQILGVNYQLTYPALCTSFNNMQHKVWMLDLGSFCEPDVDYLYQLAESASQYFQLMYQRQPKIAVLNLATEHAKGTKMVQQLDAMLTDNASGDYQGFIEPNQILFTDYDIIITDGWTGNIALKAIEGTALYCLQFLQSRPKNIKLLHIAVSQFLARQLYRLQGTLSPFKKLDPRNYNGTFLFGAKGLVVKSHGNSDQLAFYNAIELTHQLILTKQQNAKP